MNHSKWALTVSLLGARLCALAIALSLSQVEAGPIHDFSSRAVSIEVNGRETSGNNLKSLNKFGSINLLIQSDFIAKVKFSFFVNNGADVFDSILANSENKDLETETDLLSDLSTWNELFKFPAWFHDSIPMTLADQMANIYALSPPRPLAKTNEVSKRSSARGSEETLPKMRPSAAILALAFAGVIGLTGIAWIVRVYQASRTEEKFGGLYPLRCIGCFVLVPNICMNAFSACPF